MRQVGRPSPQDEIAHVGARPICERGYHDACRTLRNKSPGNPPRCRFSVVGKVVRPRARHVAKMDADMSAVPVGSQVDNVFDIDFVGADGQRRKASRKAVAHLDEQAFDGQAEVKRRRSARVEAAAFEPRAFTRDRRERPLGIVTAITRSPKPQAKPPSATWSR